MLVVILNRDIEGGHATYVSNSYVCSLPQEIEGTISGPVYSRDTESVKKKKKRSKKTLVSLCNLVIENVFANESLHFTLHTLCHHPSSSNPTAHTDLL